MTHAKKALGKSELNVIILMRKTLEEKFLGGFRTMVRDAEHIEQTDALDFKQSFLVGDKYQSELEKIFLGNPEVEIWKCLFV